MSRDSSCLEKTSHPMVLLGSLLLRLSDDRGAPVNVGSATRRWLLTVHVLAVGTHSASRPLASGEQVSDAAELSSMAQFTANQST